MARELSQKTLDKLKEVIISTPVDTGRLTRAFGNLGTTAKDAADAFGYMAKVLGGQTLPETEEEGLDINQELEQ